MTTLPLDRTDLQILKILQEDGLKHGHVLQFDGQHTKAVYALSDSLMQHDLKGRLPEQPQMERELKAIIQQYMLRMTQDRLVNPTE